MEMLHVSVLSIVNLYPPKKAQLIGRLPFEDCRVHAYVRTHLQQGVFC